MSIDLSTYDYICEIRALVIIPYFNQFVIFQDLCMVFEAKCKNVSNL